MVGKLTDSTGHFKGKVSDTVKALALSMTGMYSLNHFLFVAPIKEDSIKHQPELS